MNDSPDDLCVGAAIDEQLGNSAFEVDWNDLSSITGDAGLFPGFSDSPYA